MLPCVKQLTRVLSERLGWNRARMKLMAPLTGALPMQTTTNLAQLAVLMKPEVETDSTYRRLQRFFAGFEFGYQRLGRFLLDLVPTEPPYVAVLDRTEWHFGQKAVNVLMVGIAEGGIAYPVARRACSITEVDLEPKSTPSFWTGFFGLSSRMSFAPW